jgi:HK97 family phage prohead protease
VTNPRSLPDLSIVRAWHLPVSLRASDDSGDTDGLGLMEVRFSRFGTWYQIDSWWEGSFMERTVKGAFKRTIDAHNAARSRDAHNVKTLFNHGMDFYVGDKLLGTIESLTEETDSPLSVVRLYDTSYNRDLLPGLRDGGYGSSFLFRVVKDEWNNEPDASDHNPDRLPERTLKEVRVFEAGPVTWPANPDATAGMRCISGTDTYYEYLARRDPTRVQTMRDELTALRTGEPALSTLPVTGLATEHPTDSAPLGGHSAGLTAGERRLRLYPTLAKGPS